MREMERTMKTIRIETIPITSFVKLPKTEKGKVVNKAMVVVLIGRKKSMNARLRMELDRSTRIRQPTQRTQARIEQ